MEKRLKYILKNTSIIYLITFFTEKQPKLRIRIKIEFVKKDDFDKVIKQQSKLIFNTIHKSYENCDRYTFKQNEVVMDKR